MKKLLLLLLFSGLAFAQAPTREVDNQIVPSGFFLDEYPNENICSVKLAYLDDVEAGFTDGQCVKFRASDSMFFGGQCGTGGGSGFDFDSAAADPHQSWKFPLQRHPNTPNLSLIHI